MMNERAADGSIAAENADRKAGYALVFHRRLKAVSYMELAMSMVGLPVNIFVDLA